MLLVATMSLFASGESVDPNVPASIEPERTVRVLSNGHISGPVPPGMTLVPGGRAKLGVPEKLMLELASRENYQHLKHLISMYPEYTPLNKIPDLLVDTHEVTNLQFQKYLNAKGLKASADLLTLRWSYWTAGKQQTGLPPGHENLPISGVNLYEAQDCARWMGKRIPTEPEWEAIARHSKKPTAFYLWGEGWNAWDREACCNLHNSGRGSEGMVPSEGGKRETDISADGVFDLCGGVSEWTVSPFEPYPGFQPISDKKRGHRKKVKEVGNFNSEHRVFRGGSYMGNEFTNSVVYRAGWHPNSSAQAIGFRCVKTATPGFDRIQRAATVELALLSSDIKDQFDWTNETMAGQEILTTDSETGLVIQSDTLAFAHITRTRVSESRFMKDTIEAPVIVGIFTTTQPIQDPPLPAGSYGLYFRGKGESKAQKEEAKRKRAGRAAEDEAAKKAEEDKKKKGRSSRSKRKREEEEAKKKAEEDKKKAEEAEAAEISEEEKKALAEAAAAQKELENLGFEAKTRDLTDLPTNTDLILINNAAGETVTWLPVSREKTRTHFAQLAYMPSAGKVNASAEAAGRISVDGESNDVATLCFSLRVGSGATQPEIKINLEFAPGCFEKLELPVVEDPKKPKRSAKKSSRGK